MAARRTRRATCSASTTRGRGYTMLEDWKPPAARAGQADRPSPGVTVVKDTGARATLPPFGEEHEELRETVSRFVTKEIAPNVDEWEAAREFPRELYERCAELGFLGLKFPEEYGGQGGDPPARRGLGRGAGPLGRLGRRRRRAQRPHLDRDAADLQLRHRGAEAALAGAGHRRARRSARWGSPSRAPAPTSPASRTFAERVDGGYVVNGSKTFITNGVRADFLVCAVQDDRGGRPPAASPSSCSSARCPATRWRRSWRRWAGTPPTPASWPSPTSRCPRRTCSARRTRASS